jgi:hypothetical protein
MLYNIGMFSLCFPLSCITILPNIIYPKYVYNNKKLERIGILLTTYLISSTVYGLFFGTYYYFGIGCYIEFFYFMLTPPNRLN